MKGEHANMGAMNDNIRRAVRVELAKRDMKQADLAKQVGVAPQYMSDMMRGKVGKIPDVWAKALEVLGLELVAVPRSNRGEGAR